jgi:hypothetical protein
MFLGYALVIVSLASGNIETRSIPLKDVCYQLADTINGQQNIISEHKMPLPGAKVFAYCERRYDWITDLLTAWSQ